jgi:hypothetical protein
MSDNMNNQDKSSERLSEDTSRPRSRGQRRMLLLILVAFIVFISFVFLTQDEQSIDWMDYKDGIELARMKNKPILLAIFKRQTRFCELMVNDTYNNPDVKKFVEDNFIPILVDIDLEPEIAKKYDRDYYPVHYVMNPDLTRQVGPQMGYEGSYTFIERLERFLKELNSEDR